MQFHDRETNSASVVNLEVYRGLLRYWCSEIHILMPQKTPSMLTNRLCSLLFIFQAQNAWRVSPAERTMNSMLRTLFLPEEKGFIYGNLLSMNLWHIIYTEKDNKCWTDETTPHLHKRTALQGFLNRYYAEYVSSAKTLIVKLAFYICIRNIKPGL